MTTIISGGIQAALAALPWPSGNVSLPFCPRPPLTRVFGSGRHYSTAASRNRRPLGGLPLPPLAARNPARRRTNVANFHAADRSRDRTNRSLLGPLRRLFDVEDGLKRAAFEPTVEEIAGGGREEIKKIPLCNVDALYSKRELGT